MGRPRKASVPVPSARPALVDYSSSSEEETQQSESDIVVKKRLHRMYSHGQKNKVALYVRHHGIRKAARHYGVHHRNVQRWVKIQVSEIKNPTKCANTKGQGHKISYPQEVEVHGFWRNINKILSRFLLS